MRKRIVIGAIAAVVIGTGFYVFLVPREGSVEYHREEYAAWERGKMNWLIDRVPWFAQRVYLEQREKHLRFHGEALRRAGYGNEVPVLAD
jgi:hypothetical protein